MVRKKKADSRSAGIVAVAHFADVILATLGARYFIGFCEYKWKIVCPSEAFEDQINFWYVIPKLDRSELYRGIRMQKT